MREQISTRVSSEQPRKKGTWHGGQSAEATVAAVRGEARGNLVEGVREAQLNQLPAESWLRIVNTL
jgi:hypothetical protein